MLVYTGRQGVRTGFGVTGPRKVWAYLAWDGLTSMVMLKNGRLQPSPGRDRPLEMLKMKIDPAMCMKTKATLTKCTVINPVLGRKYTDGAKIQAILWPEMRGLRHKSRRNRTGQTLPWAPRTGRHMLN